jgi:phosphinothricin acetyltransferase
VTAAPKTVIRPACSSDSPAIATLYNRFVIESTATFELAPVDALTIAERMAASPPDLEWQVVEETRGRVVGYASVAPWKPRGAYARTVETSVYIDPDRQGRGLGKAVYGRLLDALWAQGYHAALAGIALPNTASVRLHEQLGFRPVGVLKQVGYKFGRWIDIGYWQALEPGVNPDDR